MYRILCVDDEQNILNSLRRLFRKDGYELILCATAQEAMDALKAQPVQLILSDQRMPGMTGISFLTQAKEIQPDAIRIILSGYAEIGILTEAVNQGNVYKVIFKPWNDDDLRQNVKLALQQYDLIQKNKELQNAVMRQNEELKQLNQDLEKRIAERTEELSLRNKGLIFYQDALENLPMAVIGISGDGFIAFTNRIAQRYTNNMCLLGSHIGEIFPEEISRLVTTAKESRQAQHLACFDFNGQKLIVESVAFITSGNTEVAAKRDGILLVMQSAFSM
jgi:response regulator RpfG family c-di-GMP phosphodiesterase